MRRCMLIVMWMEKVTGEATSMSGGGGTLYKNVLWLDVAIVR